MGVRDRVNDCYKHFWLGGDDECDVGDLCDADLCDVAHDSFFDHPTWEVGVNFQNTGSTVSDIKVSLSSVLTDDAVQHLPGPAETCTDPGSNDGVPPPSTVPGTVGSFLSPVADVPIDVVGPVWMGEVINGSGDFSAASELHRYFSSGVLVIDDWSMLEAGPTTVGTSAVTSDVDGFQMQLVEPEVTTAITGGWQIAVGRAVFYLNATIDGRGHAVIATNSTTVRFFQVAAGSGSCPTGVPGCLAVRPFTIAYEDEFGGTWELDVPVSTWSL